MSVNYCSINRRMKQVWIVLVDAWVVCLGTSLAQENALEITPMKGMWGSR